MDAGSFNKILRNAKSLNDNVLRFSLCASCMFENISKVRDVDSEIQTLVL